MTNTPTPVLSSVRPARMEGSIQYGRRDASSEAAAPAEKPWNESIEYEAAKWLGPWTVLINRRIGGKLFATPEQEAR